jgi:hypothetical protein
MSGLKKKKRILNASKSRRKEMNEKPLQPVKDQEQESQAIERAVYDGMQDLRAKKSR